MEENNENVKVKQEFNKTDSFKLTKKGQKPRTLTPEHLEKLKIAREKAREVQMKNTEERKKLREIEKENKRLEAEQKKNEIIEKNKKLTSKGNIEIEYEEEPNDTEPQNPIAQDIPQKEVIKKKKKKKPVVIVEESGSSDSEEDNIIYVKRRSSKQKPVSAPSNIEPEFHDRNERPVKELVERPPPVVRQEFREQNERPIIQREYIYPKNPFYNMNQFRRF